MDILAERINKMKSYRSMNVPVECDYCKSNNVVVIDNTHCTYRLYQCNDCSLFMSKYYTNEFLLETNPDVDMSIITTVRKFESSLPSSHVPCHWCTRIEPWNQIYRCSRCKLATYCCKQCQINHYPQHKALCKVSKYLTAAPKSMLNDASAILSNKCKRSNMY